MINHPNRGRARKALASIPHDHEADYAALLASVHDAFGDGSALLFETNAADLYALYLDNLPDEREVHTCTACRKFIEHFGGLVTLDESGKSTSAFWCVANVPEFYGASVAAMQREVERARVTAPFISSEPRYGMPKTGTWTHFAATPPKSRIYKHALLSAGQAMAARREDFRTVASALADFTPAMLTEALRLLQAEKLVRSERFVAPVSWLLDLNTRRASAKDSRRRDNILWSAIAIAPDGYCHPRASVVGSLLEDIASGLSFGDVKARFDAKLHPLQYQRPQAAPSAGAIALAEKTFEAMGLTPALERRWARLDEIETIWRPVCSAGKAPAGGVFGHLTPKGAAGPIGVPGMPPVTMTWDKFTRTVLSGALAIECNVPSHGNFIAMTTAVNADAPPLLKWNNPFAWYVYHGGSPAQQWGLSSGWRKVEALSRSPTAWGENAPTFLHEGVIIVLEGAQDMRNESACLFPETLRNELHGVRSVIEAYSHRAKLGDAGGPAASGLHLGKGAAGYVLRVKSAIGTTDYRIDRWD